LLLYTCTMRSRLLSARLLLGPTYCCLMTSRACFNVAYNLSISLLYGRWFFIFLWVQIPLSLPSVFSFPSPFVLIPYPRNCHWNPFRGLGKRWSPDQKRICFPVLKRRLLSDNINFSIYFPTVAKITVIPVLLGAPRPLLSPFLWVQLHPLHALVPGSRRQWPIIQICKCYIGMHIHNAVSYVKLQTTRK